MKMPKTVGEARCTVHVTKRRSFSFAVPLGTLTVGDMRVREHGDGRRTGVVDVRAGLTRRARLLVLALRALAFMRVRVNVEV